MEGGRKNEGKDEDGISITNNYTWNISFGGSQIISGIQRLF